MSDLPNLIFEHDWAESLFLIRAGTAERRQVYKAPELLDSDERHLSLRIHALRGDLAGHWSASASQSLRILFERLADGRKRVIRVTRHYDR